MMTMKEAADVLQQSPSALQVDHRDNDGNDDDDVDNGDDEDNDYNYDEDDRCFES